MWPAVSFWQSERHLVANKRRLLTPSSLRNGTRMFHNESKVTVEPVHRCFSGNRPLWKTFHSFCRRQQFGNFFVSVPRRKTFPCSSGDMFISSSWTPAPKISKRLTVSGYFAQQKQIIAIFYFITYKYTSFF